MFSGNELQSIGTQAFARSGLTEFIAPYSLQEIGEYAFARCPFLKRVDLSACLQCDDCETAEQNFLARSVFGGSGLEDIRLPRALKVINTYTFAMCKNLKSISFDADSALEEIGLRAFWKSGLESFTAPPSLKKISVGAFFQCCKLKDLVLNEDLQELGWMCLWMTPLYYVTLPPHVRLSPEQLGIGHRCPEVLCLPQGLEVAGRGWF